MSISLVDFLPRLPEAEVSRLQKRLRVILRNCSESRRLRLTLQNVFESLGQPSRRLTGLGPEFLNVFQKLLDNFGVLSGNQMETRERELLEKIPYVVWTDDDHCRLCAEAEGSIARDQYFREEGYLFNAIRALPVKEKRAWAAWLEMNGTTLNQGNIERELYANMATRRMLETETEAANAEEAAEVERAALPEFLRDVFPESDAHLPVSWFYRGVLPLYNALAETGRAAADHLNPLQKKVLHWMKVGQVVAHAVTPDFGEELRFRLVWTREKCDEAAGLSANAEDRTPATQEQLLF